VITILLNIVIKSIRNKWSY